MKQEDVENILRMRVAVYQAGVNAGFWKDINAQGAADMMNYIFPKTGQMAYYQLLMEQMREEHKMLTGGVYSLFKLPVQIEKEILDFLRGHSFDATDHLLDIVCIGTFSANEIETELRLCASHYRHSFSNQIKSYPYFE